MTATTPTSPATAIQTSALPSTALPSTALPTTATRATSPLVAAAVVLAVLFFFLALGGDAAATSPTSPSAPSPASVEDSIEIYVVQPGDTLWSIASSIATEDDDMSSLVDALNDLAGGASLEIGDRLVIDHTTIRS